MIQFFFWLGSVIFIGGVYASAFVQRYWKVAFVIYFTIIGFYFTVLWVLGIFNIGNFYFYYGPAVINCIKEISK